MDFPTKSSTSTLFTQLDSALQDVAAKKAKVDEAEKAYHDATSKHTEAVNKAQDLRDQLTQMMSSMLPNR